MYTITLNDGTIISNLYNNCNNFISNEEIDINIFTNNMKLVKVVDENNTLNNEYKDIIQGYYLDSELLYFENRNNQYWFTINTSNFVSFEDYTPPTLEETKESKLLEIKQAFETVYLSGYTNSSLGYRIDANQTSLLNVQGLIREVNSGSLTTITFRDYDNNYHILSGIDDLYLFESEITKQGFKLYEEKWNLENQLTNATTIEEVNVIDPHSMSGYDW